MKSTVSVGDPVLPRRNPGFKGALAVLATVAVTFLPFFVLTVYPQVMLGRRDYVHAVERSRALSIGLAVVLALIVALRHRLRALLGKLQAHVARTVDTCGLTAPPLESPRLSRVWVAAAVAVGLASVVVAILSTREFRVEIREDGIIEYGTSISWFVAALCTVVALFIDRSRFYRKLAIYLPLMFLLIFAGGEEISWGQRIFHYQVPIAIQTINKQREMNFHDIGSISVMENGFFVFTTVCCLILPWFLSRAQEWRTYLHLQNAPFVDRSVAQVYGIGLAAWIIIGVRFGTLGFSPLSLWGYYTQNDDEIWEFFAAFGFLALTSLDLVHRLAGTRRLEPMTGHAR